MSLAYEEIYTELENDLIKIIAKSVKKIDFETNFEHEKMTGMIGLTDEAVRLIGKASGKAADEIERMIKESGTAVLANDEALYKMAYERGIFQIRPLPLTASPAIREIFRAAMVNAETTLNFTNTSARISAQKAYYRAVNRAYMETYTGVKSFDAAVRDAVKDMAERGITQVTYSGTRENGQEWERRDHIDVAVRRNVLTTVNQSNGLLAIERAREWGSNLVEVSRHLGERPSHAEWSGKIYAIDGTQGRYDNLASATGYGTAGGLKGVNCRHTFWAFVEGISTPIDYDKLGYPDKEENARIYEESQEQRRLEREIRAIKREIAALEGLGEDVGAASLRLKRKQAELRAFIDSTGRTRRRNREWISKTELDKLKKG
ncbi:MAG: phage minor capsid protein, partial [Oscillospiraceae bacterium]|nr:phage minor capsid protein [Oscillospiraceae bacterium]